MALSLLVSVFIIVLAWQRRWLPGALTIMALLGSAFMWTLGFFIEAHSSTLQQQLFFNNIGYIGSMTLPVAWFIFALQYSSYWRISRRMIVLLYVISTVILVLVWTNSWHHLMWSNEQLTMSGYFLVTSKVYMPLFWVAMSYNYLLILSGTALIIRHAFMSINLHKGQTISIIVAVSLPLVWNLIYVFNLFALPRKDLTPVMFAFSGLAFTLGLVRFGLLAVVPFAHKFVIQQMNEGVIVFDFRNYLLEANPAALRTIGLGKSIIGRRLEDLSPLSPVFEQISLAGFERFEMTLKASGGDALYYEVEKVLMRDSRGRHPGWLAILHDVTQSRTLQKHLILQDRMASIGQLTSGVAHELNNPLTSIIGFSDILLQKKLDDDIKNDLKIINDEAHRTAKIVKNLLTFARQQPLEKQLININDCIQKVLVLRAYEQKVNNVQVNINLDPDLPRIMGNSSQLQQVFFNLVINAEFFMHQAHKKGSLSITTEKAANFVRASFADDGPGISQENISRLFNPFFTTKETGKGTGLGLSICHGIVTEHNGRIWAESDLGKGATFFVELPIPLD